MRTQIKGGHDGVTSGRMICFKKNFPCPVLDDFIYYRWAHKTSFPTHTRKKVPKETYFLFLSQSNNL